MGVTVNEIARICGVSHSSVWLENITLSIPLLLFGAAHRSLHRRQRALGFPLRTACRIAC